MRDQYGLDWEGFEEIALVDDLKEMEGDWIFVGAGGKMGPTMVRMASRGLERAGSSARGGAKQVTRGGSRKV